MTKPNENQATLQGFMHYAAMIYLADRNFAIPSGIVQGMLEAAEAARQLAGKMSAPDQVHAALTEWLKKTQWVQAEASGKYLGMHRADVMRAMFDELEKEVAALRKTRRWNIREIDADTLEICKGDHDGSCENETYVRKL